MKKQINGIFLIGILCGCASSSIKHGLYKSKCQLYDLSALKLNIKPDQTFQYYFASNDDTIIGTWQVKQDTLFLISNKFLEKREPLTPKIKNSDLVNIDAYIIKGKVLKLINSVGVTDDCSLKLSK
jgi:hypothetical protein